MITRRDVLVGASALAICGSLGRRAFARTSIENAGVRIDTVSDGSLRLPGSLVFEGLPQDELADILSRYEGASPEGVDPPCNLTLMRDGERTVLFDVGSGPNFMPSAGKIGEALEAIQVDPSEVTHVVFTHAHPDHLWGLLDEFDDPLFSEAEYLIGEAEHDYWIDPKTVETIGEMRQAFAAGAARNLAAIEDQITRFKPDQEILPGVASRATFGHTPGHMSFELKAGSESVLVIGDAIANPHIAFERPEWETNMDQDKSAAAKTRVGLLDQAASEKMRVIGFHLPNGGLGRVEKKGTGYRFVPEGA